MRRRTSIAFGARDSGLGIRGMGTGRTGWTGNWQLATGYWRLATGNWRLCSLPRKSISMRDARTARPAPVRNAECWRDAGPEETEQQACGEAADAKCGVVDAERGAA